MKVAFSTSTGTANDSKIETSSGSEAFVSPSKNKNSIGIG